MLRLLRHPGLALGWRDLKMPDSSDPRFWEKSEIWWGNWQHNFIRSLIFFPALVIVILIVVAVVLS